MSLTELVAQVARPVITGMSRPDPVRPPAGTAVRRVVVIADADSFVKWGAALVDEVRGISAHLLLVRTPLRVSGDQERAAVAGTRFAAPGARTRIDLRELRGWLDWDRPDVVVLAGRGPLIRLLQREIDRLVERPVVVTGLPGASVPALRGALSYRAHSDLVVVHSHRERRAYRELARRIRVDVPIALATLPFARTAGGLGASGAEPATDLVFAAQALVPSSREDRARIAGILRRAALAEPSRRVVVKLRARPGEAQTHAERDGYPELIAAIGPVPPNLVFSYGSMREALARAEGLVTIGSTAAIEAIAAGVPVIALDLFGFDKALLNTVFADSGLRGGEEDVVARRFRRPDPRWLTQNYFHDPAESDWWATTRRLVAQRRRGALAPRTAPAPRGGPLHAAWQRKSVLGAEDRTLSGAVALVLGTPVVRAIVAVRRWRGRRGIGAWTHAASDFTLSPSPHRDRVRPAR
ncbi:hypothetical protein K8F61_13815 [Microbacterium resistens]|uniref:Uncharacterized protein n=1 Tax=Microbacterium resistens TaxID=156977 RepID=A0ABY3RS76_9MICO|nr:DUF6716 putative glycosyltransferase [Microbacterium resistens]UGS25729.1 hypothetical protein K8F61_13815 [Microbacterium resistens]